MTEQTCCLIKPDAYPDAVHRIIKRLLGEGFRIRIAGTFIFNEEMIDAFYAEHIGKPYYDNLKTCMMEGPTFGMVLQRDNAIKHLRDLMGPAKIENRRCGQIRYEYGSKTNVAKNAIHGSDSAESAWKEIELVFQFIWFCA